MARDLQSMEGLKLIGHQESMGRSYLWGGKLVKVLKLEGSGFQNDTARKTHPFLASSGPQ